MKFLKKVLLLAFLGSSGLKSWAVSIEEFTKKTKLLLEQIVSKSSRLDIKQEDINNISNFLKNEWEKKKS